MSAVLCCLPPYKSKLASPLVSCSLFVCIVNIEQTFEHACMDIEVYHHQESWTGRGRGTRDQASKQACSILVLFHVLQLQCLFDSRCGAVRTS